MDAMAERAGGLASERMYELPEADGPARPGVRLRIYDRSTRLAEIRAVYRSRLRVSERTPIRCGRDAAEYLRKIWHRDRLEFVEDCFIVCLNTASEALGWVRISSGGLSASVVDPRVVFAIALQTASSALILAHNHPSGGPEPSPEDVVLTKRLAEAGQLLAIRVVDHIILTKDGYYSFEESGRL